MTYVIIRHEVKDYRTWKKAFDDHGSMRKENGEQSIQIFREADHENVIIAMAKWDTLERAKQFFESDDLKKGMEEAGVVGKPHMHFLNEI
ncbi:MAG: cyclase [Candidatus Aenigmatarchaeota archaeon]